MLVCTYPCCYCNSPYLLNKCPNLDSALSNADFTTSKENTEIVEVGNKEVYASNTPIANKRNSNTAIDNKKDSNTTIDNKKNSNTAIDNNKD